MYVTWRALKSDVPFWVLSLHLKYWSDTRCPKLCNVCDAESIKIQNLPRLGIQNFSIRLFFKVCASILIKINIYPTFQRHKTCFCFVFLLLLFPCHLQWVKYCTLPFHSDDEHSIDRARDCHVLKVVSNVKFEIWNI